MEKYVKDIKVLLNCDTDTASEVIDYLVSSDDIMSRVKKASSKFDFSPVLIVNVFKVLQHYGVV